MDGSSDSQTPYQMELKVELGKLDPAEFCHASRLLTEETRRVESGDKYQRVPMVELHNRKPSSNALKVRIPIQEFPKINFVGKLLGPKGNTLKQLQQETGCKLSILGRGSMRDKKKEEELRKEGGKYAHLNEDLHVMIECFAQTVDAYARISHALTEIKKFMDPANYDEMGAPLREEQQQFYNGEERMLPGHGQAAPPTGRGGLLSTPAALGRGGMTPRSNSQIAYRGGSVAPRGGLTPRGSPAVRGSPAPRGTPSAVRPGAPAARGALPARGTPPPRGAQAGRGRGLPSLAAPTRALAAPAPRPQPLAPEYDDYGAAPLYEEESEYGQPSRYDDGYGRQDPYAETSAYTTPAAGAGDTQYFDYGHGAQTYRDEYAEPARPIGHERSALKAAPLSGRGRGALRQHPYEGGRGMSQGRAGGY